MYKYFLINSSLIILVIHYLTTNFIIQELDAYAKMVSALRAQGPLTEGKQKLLGDLATALHISNDRHQAEIRRAVNDDKLSLIAEQ